VSESGMSWKRCCREKELGKVEGKEKEEEE
jgi:hypothetical protein